MPPLLDITAGPAARLKRRAKAPGGALGDKLKKKKAIPSSLPPSSPPLPSSSGKFAYNDEPNSPIADYMFDLDSHHSIPRVASSNPPSDSDPFGFFAVERKLKVKRALQPAPASYHRSSTPSIPSTPHKPKPKPRASKRKSSSNSDDSDAPENSPSPVKPRRSIPAATEDEDDMSEVEEQVIVKPKAKPRARRVAKKPKTAVAKRATANPEPESKPVRRSTRIRSGKKESDDDDEEVQPRARRPARGRRVVKPEEADEEDIDVDDKMTARQARLDYFKRLEDYSIAKENVYVV